ncbi:TetR/AcrR family transcriptional regulator [Candidatus Contubernalis alkaliaceticus]|uniref:TetR/AcrR family transcriptional regulator n=1 Tax=Candidatus Contubernalis alkaliaceticus TaxID=338645 RepID=UPI001F4C2EC9|nr:TetR/AcrR family transcriptional regulator [Candidatus Contubernalis alkalaceticus]UNC93039.1 TetR/AcrR family transcriptional regulator [Candidatus Contubernalis alkalaceticus]
MKKSHDDRRIRKTKVIIRKTLTQLLMEKDLKDITVSELTEIADINRGTFYLHYKDLYDLFEQIEKEIMDDFIGIITKYRKLTQVPLMPVLLEAFKYFAANSQIFIAILRTKETTFLNQVIDMCRPQNNKEWQSLFASDKDEYYEYYYSFIAFGCVALLRRWFDNGMTESPEQMAALAEKLMANCTRDLP